jgi:hypothetical protein
MVPYSSFPYAHHALKEVGADPNAKADFAEHCDKLIEAAHLLKDLVKGMEDMEDIPGFTIYSENDKKKEDDEESKEEEGEEKLQEVQDIAIEGMLEKFKDI